MLRWLTAGESHGPELVAILEGLPAGIPVSLDAIRADLARRKLGYGRGARMKFEQDELAISGGVRHGVSLGSPIALRIGNTEWPKWQEVMSPEPVDPAVLGRGRGAPLTRPRLSGSIGSGLMTSCHFGHSVLPMRRAIGLPRDSP